MNVSRKKRERENKHGKDVLKVHSHEVAVVQYFISNAGTEPEHTRVKREEVHVIAVIDLLQQTWRNLLFAVVEFL